MTPADVLIELLRAVVLLVRRSHEHSVAIGRDVRQRGIGALFRVRADERRRVLGHRGVRSRLHGAETVDVQAGRERVAEGRIVVGELQQRRVGGLRVGQDLVVLPAHVLQPVAVGHEERGRGRVEDHPLHRTVARGPLQGEDRRDVGRGSGRRSSGSGPVRSSRRRRRSGEGYAPSADLVIRPDRNPASRSDLHRQPGWRYPHLTRSRQPQAGFDSMVHSDTGDGAAVRGRPGAGRHKPHYDVPSGFTRCSQATAWHGFFKWASVRHGSCTAADRFMDEYARHAGAPRCPSTSPATAAGSTTGVTTTATSTPAVTPARATAPRFASTAWSRARE